METAFLANYTVFVSLAHIFLGISILYENAAVHSKYIAGNNIPMKRNNNNNNNNTTLFQTAMGVAPLNVKTTLNVKTAKCEKPNNR